MKNKNNMYTQCLLTRKIKANQLQEIAWIPTAYAIIGKYLEIKDSEGVWVNGWKVSAKYQTKDGAYITEHERDYLKQRKASDI